MSLAAPKEAPLQTMPGNMLALWTKGQDAICSNFLLLRWAVLQ